MYLVIFEDYTITKIATLTNELYDAHEAGILQLIDITDPDEPTEFNGDKWVPIVEEE
jgi:hypothetical protein